MHALLSVLRRTWLATTLFVVVSTAIWWKWLDWETARENLLLTVFLSPVVWWASIGRKRPPHLLRGLAAGALTGLVTQMAPHARFIWPLVSHAGTGEGDDQIIAAASAGAYLMIGLGALIVGALIGLIATAIERMMHSWTAGAGAPASR